jgi:hypothetical protein
MRIGSIKTTNGLASLFSFFDSDIDLLSWLFCAARAHTVSHRPLQLSFKNRLVNLSTILSLRDGIDRSCSASLHRSIDSKSIDRCQRL